jgi:two-component system, LytTR family, sensor histidine kinase AlgZ
MKQHQRAPSPTIFLPDLCGVRALFAVVMISELLVFVLMLTRTGFAAAALPELALLSLYVQFSALSAAAALCMSRPGLSQLPEAWAVMLSYGLILVMVSGVCELAWWVLNPALGDGALINLSHRDFFSRTLGISAIAAALILRYFYVQFHWQQQTAAESRARLQALQARIRPHFFFNCMNTIASLTRSDPASAERAVEDLADLFRASLSDGRDLVTLAEEFELARHYLRIEALRLGSRLQVDWQIEAVPLSAVIPQLTLQPLLENAIYHGIEPLAGGGIISLEGRVHGAEIEFVIRNPFSAAHQQHAGNRLAQDNVRQRLEAHFGARGRLTLATSTDEYLVRVWIPLQHET